MRITRGLSRGGPSEARGDEALHGAVVVRAEGVGDVVPARAQLVLDGSHWKNAPHKNKYGKDYKTDERY